VADKFNSGDPLFKLPTLRAAFVNDLVDLLAWAKLNGFGGRPSPAEAFSTPTDIVKVRNLVGGDCELGDVVQLGDELLDDKDKRYPWFEGNAVDDPAERRWAILLQPIKTGDVGMAIVSGVCLVNVTVGSTSDTHGTPASASASLTSGTSGPIEILSPIGSTGPQLLWCRLGGGGGGGSPEILPFKFTGDLAVGMTAGAIKGKIVSGAWSFTGDTTTVYDTAKLGPAKNTWYGWLYHSPDSGHDEIISIERCPGEAPDCIETLGCWSIDDFPTIGDGDTVDYAIVSVDGCFKKMPINDCP
jgi:hypothetical protein